jgi:transcription initiation factor TFIIF subunit beta
MEGIVEDEKKPFDAEAAQDDDAQPDPDEHLMLDQGNGRVWLVKVRKTLPQAASIENWSSLVFPRLDPQVPYGTLVSGDC